MLVVIRGAGDIATGIALRLFRSVIGSGGKTTLLRTLSRELPGTVILTTTTHILPFEGVPLLTAPTEDEVRAALARSRVLCLGTPAPEGKLTAPSLPFSLLEQLADYVLVEADGSRRLPLKAHAPHEPVIPKEAGCVLCVVGARGFDRPIREAVHRPEQFCTLTGARLDEPASPALAARALAAEGYCYYSFALYFLIMSLSASTAVVIASSVS